MAILIAGLLVWWPTSGAPSQSLDDESRACQICHGLEDWQIRDPVAKRTIFLSIDVDDYLRSSHGSLACRGCHDPGYSVTLPHHGPSSHPLYLCVLCHEDDPALGWLDLAERKSDLQQSAHGDTKHGRLDCHDCHDPHRFRPINDSEDALRRIERSNAICLECHGPGPARQSRFDQGDASSAHDRFPNYENHLRKVKCIACHSEDSDSTHHDITAADQAVSECSGCHSPTSPLLDVIYEPQRAEQTNSLVDDAYVIGSARSPRLERLSVGAFLALIGVISVHSLARLLHALRRRRSSE